MNFKKLFGAGLVAGAFAISSIGAAGAAVTFDPATGTGFVGKGDVQMPFGWNDAALQAKATGVTFGYVSSTDDAYQVVCGWDTTSQGGGKNSTGPIIKHHVQTKSANIGSSVTYDITKIDRKNPNGKVTGFQLTGKTGEVIDEAGSVPVVGGDCPESQGDGIDKTIESVSLLSSTSTAALTAYHLVDGKSAVIWPPAPAPVV